MELRHLRYFQAVAEELSFSGAARRLRIAQPALSRAVKEIEHELGALVLDRNRSRVRLTPVGAVLLAEAGLVLERWEAALLKVRRTVVGEEGELSLGYIGPPTRLFLGPLLAEYRLRYPRISIHLEERTPERVWEMVARGSMSLGLTRPVPGSADPGMQTLLLREERLGMVVPAGHPAANTPELSWRNLEGEPLIVLARREGVGLYNAILSGCGQAGWKPRFVHTPSLVGTVLSYVEAGAGAGIVTDSVVPRGGALRFVPLTPVVTVPLVLVWREDAVALPQRRFIELMQEWMASGRLWSKG